METKETSVVMDTTLGKIKIKLYNDTPQHRDNFIKLAKAGQYDGLLFHRVIKDFMVQGGDVTSKDAPMNKPLGAGDLGYTVPAEFNYPKYFHKKGALCAARTGDEVNPEKASSASQFYIVTGKKYSEAELGQMEKQIGGASETSHLQPPPDGKQAQDHGALPQRQQRRARCAPRHSDRQDRTGGRKTERRDEDARRTA